MNEPRQTMTRYLLGELSEAEQTALEEQYFSDPLLFDQLVAVENEIVDQYARGQLQGRIRDRVEAYYLAHSERRARAEFAEALTAKMDQIRVPASPRSSESWWQRVGLVLPGPKLIWGFSMALLLLVAGLTWLAFETRRLNLQLIHNETERVAIEQREHDLQRQLADERARADQLTSELDRARAQPTAVPTPTPPGSDAIATLILNINGVRGAQTGPPAPLIIAPGTQSARLQLNLKDLDYLTYAILIQAADGTQIYNRAGLRPSKPDNSLSIIVPARKFANGDYILTLKGASPAGEIDDLSKSFFRVTQSHPVGP